MRPFSPSRLPIRARLTAAVVLLALTASAPRTAPAQGAAGSSGAVEGRTERALPFGVGDTLTYSARVAKVGRVGKAVMWVDGPTEVRGTAAWVLHFSFSARV